MGNPHPARDTLPPVRATMEAMKMKKIIMFYEFLNNTLFYWQRGHTLRDAINMAHRVIPENR